MTWPDFVVIVLCILLAIVESRRGFIVGFFDMIGVVLTIEIAAGVYGRFVSPSLSYHGAYLVCVGVGVVVVAALTTLLKRQTQIDIGSFDSALGGLMGVVAACVLSHAMYGALVLAYGQQAEVYTNSVFAAQLYELQGWRGFLGFMGRVGTSEVAQ